jgi:hypothetical protein
MTTVERLTQVARDRFENTLVGVAEWQGVYWVTRQRSHEEPGRVRLLKPIGPVSAKYADLKAELIRIVETY